MHLDLQPAHLSPRLSSPATPTGLFSTPIAPATAIGSEESTGRVRQSRLASASTERESAARTADEPDLNDTGAPQTQQPPAKATEETSSRHLVAPSVSGPVVLAPVPGNRATSIASSMLQHFSSFLYGESRIFPLPLCVTDQL